MHEVIRTINGRQYRYLEESYRVPGLRTPRKRSTYLGPVEPVERKRKVGIFGVIDDLVRKKHDWEYEKEKPHEEKERIAREDAERERTARNNDLLSGKSITLAELAEVAETQGAFASQGHSDSQADQSLGDAGETAS